MKLPPVLSNAERGDHMQQALNRFPFLRKRGGFTPDKVSIACYGPSLNDTWPEMPRPIISVSGAHDFLVERGVIPSWHVDIDPRPNKAAMLHPQNGTKYLMATVCHPDVWDVLEGYDVELWHLINGDDYQTLDWVGLHHPAGLECMIGGGSTAGLRAMNVAAALGFRRFDIYGMDCSFRDEQHAGPHTGTPETVIRVTLGNRTFRTTPYMMQAAREMEQFLLTADAEVTLHGDGLMQEIANIQSRKVNA